MLAPRDPHSFTAQQEAALPQSIILTYSMSHWLKLSLNKPDSIEAPSAITALPANFYSSSKASVGEELYNHKGDLLDAFIFI